MSKESFQTVLCIITVALKYVRHVEAAIGANMLQYCPLVVNRGKVLHVL